MLNAPSVYNWIIKLCPRYPLSMNYFKLNSNLTGWLHCSSSCSGSVIIISLTLVNTVDTKTKHRKLSSNSSLRLHFSVEMNQWEGYPGSHGQSEDPHCNGFFCCHASSRVHTCSRFRNLAGLGILRHFARVGSQEAAKAEAPREAHENSLRTENREREQGAALDYRFQPSSDQPEVSGEYWAEEKNNLALFLLHKFVQDYPNWVRASFISIIKLSLQSNHLVLVNLAHKLNIFQLNPSAFVCLYFLSKHSFGKFCCFVKDQVWLLNLLFIICIYNRSCYWKWKTTFRYHRKFYCLFNFSISRFEKYLLASKVYPHSLEKTRIWPKKQWQKPQRVNWHLNDILRWVEGKLYCFICGGIEIIFFFYCHYEQKLLS